MSRRKIAIVFGGRSVEHEVSIVSARTVASGLEGAGYEVIPVGVAPDGRFLDRELSRRALDGEIDALPGTGDDGAPGGAVAPTLVHLVESEADVVFPIVHGTFGEDGTLQGLCEMMDVPYVGAGVTASAAAMDKLVAKRLLAAEGIPVLDFVAVRDDEVGEEGWRAEARDLGLPVFVKPSVGGSSVGVSRVSERHELLGAVRQALSFSDAVLVERAATGRELECSVLGDRELEASAVGEIVPGREFYDYADKYLDDEAGLLAPADLDPGLEARIRELAVAAFRAVRGWGMARVDFLLHEGRPYVNELNTIPGFTSISMYPRLWELAGVPLPELVERLVAIAISRHERTHRLDAGIAAWLAELERRRQV